MDDFQKQQQQIEKERNEKKKESRHCKKCGATLDSDDKFCPECGEKIGGEERKCRWCGFSTTKEICPECGNRVVPRLCPKCGKESYFDICENCGEILNQELQEFAQEKQEPSKQMSEEEALEIQKEFSQSENLELEYFKKKIKEHEILLAEKKFFDEREKRITDAFGDNFTSIKYPDPEETKFLQEVSEGLKQAALQKEQEEIQKQLNKKIPGAKSPEEEHEELLKLVKQREELFNKNIAESEKEIKDLQKKIEEQRKREEEIAREKRRLEIEAFNRRICGTYIKYNYGEEIKLSIEIDENGNLTGKDLTRYDDDNLSKYSGALFAAKFKINNWDGTKFDFIETERQYIKNPNNLKIDALLYKFHGTLNADGTVIHGYWFSDEHANNYCDYRKY